MYVDYYYVPLLQIEKQAAVMIFTLETHAKCFWCKLALTKNPNPKLFKGLVVGSSIKSINNSLTHKKPVLVVELKKVNYAKTLIL